jgi:hypothetical protein
MKKDKRVEFFFSFEEENQAEYLRRKKMSIEERIKEFSALQERAWGKNWTSVPVVKSATYESVSW